jgi:hypothetical protein
MNPTTEELLNWCMRNNISVTNKDGLYGTWQLMAYPHEKNGAVISRVVDEDLGEACLLIAKEIMVLSPQAIKQANESIK